MTARSVHPKAWDIYAWELFHLGYGHPLWTPDPENSQCEVEIADVGYLRDGEFLHLLKTRSERAEDQPYGLLPDKHLPFKLPQSSIRGPREKITQSVLHSRTIKTFDFKSDIGVKKLPASMGGSIELRCAEDKGALLVISPYGEETFITSKRRIVNYMREHLTSWIELSKSDGVGIGLEREEILFVSSVIKTRRWGVAAFYGSQKGAQASISIDAGEVVSGGIAIDCSKLCAPVVSHKTGPSRPRSEDNVDSLTLSSAAASLGLYSSPSQSIPETGSSVSVASSATVPDSLTSASWRESLKSSSSLPIPTTPQAPGSIPGKATQCIFFHYYKAKRRVPFLGIRLKAGAGYHELPPIRDDKCFSSGVLAEDGSSHGGPELDFEVVSSESKPYDPVNAALDYILENSNAEMAIASDLDLYALFKDQDFPSDVAKQLAQLRPQVEVDESGVGTFVADASHDLEQAGEESEGSSRVQRATSSSDGPQCENRDATDSDGFALQPGKRPVHAAPLTADEYSAIPNTGKKDPSNETRHVGSVTALTYSPDGRYLACGAEDASISIRDAHANTMIHTFQAHNDTISALAFSPDGAVLASASECGEIKLWTSDAFHKELLTVDVGESFRFLAFTPDGSKLLGGSSDGTLNVWDASSIALLGTNQYDDDVSFIVFSADGRMMATGGTENTCHVWEVADLDIGNPKVVLSGHERMITSALFSRDGKRIVTGSFDGSCRIWRTKDGKELATLFEHSGAVRSVCYSPDGTCVVSGSDDSTVKVWDTLTGNRLLSLEAHDDAVHKVAYSLDGAYIASASTDNTVRLWRAKDGAPVQTYNEHGDLITSMEFSPDRKTLASGSDDGTVHIRPISAAAQSVSNMQK